LRSIHPWCHK